MEIGERIAILRKEKRISQEQLANEIEVSRQAVSKWELNQSVPDLDKVIVLSKYFNVSTDYLLKGINDEKNSDVVTSRILYIASTLAITIGLLVTLGGWDNNKPFEGLAVGMLIQAVGLAAYFIGKSLSREKPHFSVKFLNITIVLYLPLSSIIGRVCKGSIIPYPTDVISSILLISIYTIITFATYFILKKANRYS
ncbi:MAG: helix-turn-helix transcriptional regulator [Coprobacillus sp.]